MTLTERERLAYITNDVTAPELARQLDLQHKLDLIEGIVESGDFNKIMIHNIVKVIDGEITQ